MAPIMNIPDEDDYQKMVKVADAFGINYLNPKSLTEQVAELNTSDYIVIPHEFTNGRYSRSVDPARLACSFAVERAGKSLDLELANTARDSLGREFVGNMNWQQQMNLLDALGVSGVLINVNADFLRLLDEGAEGNMPVYDESGKQLKPKYLAQVRDDVVEIMSPWRAERLDAFFEKREDGLYILTRNKTEAEKLSEDTLMEDKRISRASWLENPTEQGLPRTDVKEGSLSYWYPRDGAVARSDAYSNGSNFDCDRDPSFRFSDLGVRASKKRE